MPQDKIIVTPGQHELYLLMKKKNSLATKSEVFDIYTEYVMTNETTCKFNPYVNKGEGQYEDYPIWELENKARQWYRLALGSLMLKKAFEIKWV